MDVKTQIEFWRSQRDLTVNELSELAKVSRMTISRAELGLGLSTKSLQKISTALRVPIIIMPEERE